MLNKSLQPHGILCIAEERRSGKTKIGKKKKKEKKRYDKFAPGRDFFFIN